MLGSAAIGAAGWIAAATSAAGSTRTGWAMVLGGSTGLGSRTGARDSTSVDHSIGGFTGSTRGTLRGLTRASAVFGGVAGAGVGVSTLDSTIDLRSRSTRSKYTTRSEERRVGKG